MKMDAKQGQGIQIWLDEIGKSYEWLRCGFVLDELGLVEECCMNMHD